MPASSAGTAGGAGLSGIGRAATRGAAATASAARRSIFDRSQENYLAIPVEQDTDAILLEIISENTVVADEVIGFVTRGRGVTVHQSSCKSLPLLNHESDRLMQVNWNVRSSKNFNVRLKIKGQDSKGWLKDISECISKQNVNIASVDTKTKDSLVEAHFIVQINNNRQLSRLIRKMTKIKNIDYVERTSR